MLSPNGRIEFSQELLDLIDAFLEQYQAQKGPLNNDLERSLVVAYVLGVLRCDLECVWDSVGRAPALGSLQPRSLFEECAQHDTEQRAERQAELLRQMVERGWFSTD